MKRNSNNNGNVILALAVSVLSIIGIFVLFADAFSEATWGTGFEVIFGLEDKSTVLCPGLLVGFIFACIAVFLPFLAIVLDGKARGGVYLFTAITLIVAGTIYLCARPIFLGTNNFNTDVDVNRIEYLGAGFITSIVFNYLGAALCLVGAYAGHVKNQDDED